MNFMLFVKTPDTGNEKTAKVGVKIKRLKAGWDEQYLRKIIQGI